MRKTLFLLSVLLSIAFTVSAQEKFEIDRIKYYILDDATVGVMENDTLVRVGGRKEYISKYRGKIVIPESVTNDGHTYKVVEIKNNAFMGCEDLTEVILPNSILTIGSSAFTATPSLKTVVLGNSVEELGYGAFKYSGIPNIELPSSLLYLREGCLSFTKIKELVIPNSVISIEAEALSSSPYQQIYLGSGLKYLDVNAFGLADELLNISVDPSNKYFAERDGILFTKDFSKLIKYPGGRKGMNYSVPEETTLIQSYAFDHCDLKNVNMPNVTMIEYYGINDSKIENLNLPKVSVLGQGAFIRCNISHLILGNKLATVYPRCFSFSDFDMITYYATSPLPLRSEQYQFSVETYEKAVLRIPVGCMKYYESAPGWEYFEHIEEFDPASGITEVENDGAVNLTWKFNSSEITISNPTGGMVGVYDMTGRIVFIGTQETITVPYNPIYIIRQGNKSSKVYFPAY